MPYVEIRGLRVHYQQSGHGPDVILVHGLTSSLAMWSFSGIIQALATDFRVTAYDLRAHGASQATASGYTSADLAADLRGLHGTLGLEPAYLVGHSFGGVVAFHAAVLFPAIVRGIVLSDSYFPGLRHLEPDLPSANVWQNLRRTLQEAGAEIGPIVDFLRLFQTARELSSDQWRTIRERLGPIGAGWLRQTGRLADTTVATDAFSEAGLSAEAIASVKHPVAALYDEHSPLRATADFLRRRLAQCVVETVPGAEHLALLQSPKEFVALVHKHLCGMAGIEHLAAASPRYGESPCGS